MNLGLQHANGDYVCLINNDLYVGPNWNEIPIAEMERVGLCAASPLGLEMMPTPELTAWVQDRWASIGRGRLSSGKASSRLRTMIREMYGDWEGFCAETHRFFSGKVYDGIIGSCAMLRRDLFEKIGMLDERIQSADWDLYYTLRKRENKVGDVRRCMIVGGSYVHHFMRATAAAKPEPYACRHERLSIDEKWTRKEQLRLWCKPEELLAPRSATSTMGIIRGRIVKLIRKLVREMDRALSWRWLLVNPDQIVNIYRRKFVTMG